jgi:hypothetical protein
MAPTLLNGTGLTQDGPAPNAAQALKDALAVLDKKALLEVLLKIVENNPIVEGALEKKMLVRGRDVVRYHVDTDSEDDESGERGSNGENTRSEERRPIAIKDHEATGRTAMCLNCENRFDVTENVKGDCKWHEGSLTALSHFHLVLKQIE